MNNLKILERMREEIEEVKRNGDTVELLRLRDFLDGQARLVSEFIHGIRHGFTSKTT